MAEELDTHQNCHRKYSILIISENTQELVKKTSKSVQNYLDCEHLLSQFFQTLNYCGPHCLTKSNRYDKKFPNHIGCCTEDWCLKEEPDSLPAIFLAQQRQQKYGSQKENHKFCGYHVKNNGCTLQDHKPSICIAYICKSNMKHLNEKYKITYSPTNVEAALEIILTKHVNPDEINAFKAETKRMIERISLVDKKQSESKKLPPITYPHLPDTKLADLIADFFEDE